MNSEYFISIIIPVYNVEKYIKKCLDSIFEGQDFQNFEVILINDGSPDSCPAICDFYSQKYPHVKVIHKTNGGVSSARNEGLRVAEGKYIMFIDPDDYIEKNSLQKIVEFITIEGETDVVFLNSVNIYPDGTTELPEKYENELFNKKSRSEIISSRAYKDFLSCFPNKLIKREIIVNNDMCFDEKMKRCGDADFSIKLLLCAETYSASGVRHYFHRYFREDSLTHICPKTRLSFDFYLISKWTGLAKTEYKEYESVLYSWMAIIYCCVIIPYYSTLPKEIKNVYKKEIDGLKWLLKYSNGGKAALLKTCYYLFGLNFLSCLLKLYCIMSKRKF